MKKIWFKGKKPRMVMGIWFYPNKPTVVSDEIYKKLIDKEDWVAHKPKEDKKD